MISIIKESPQDFSFLLKLHHLSPEQKVDIESAICAEGDSNSYDCGDYLLVIPNDDYTTFDKMSAVIRSLMDKYGERAPDVNERWHYKFEDLKPVFATNIVGDRDPNDEYYPRQKVDAAICELDAHRLCFDTDRKYYMKVAEDRRKRLISCENKLINGCYRRCRRCVKDCRENIEYWKNICNDKADMKVVLWQKWEKRWEALSYHFKPWLAGMLSQSYKQEVRG